MERLNQLNMAQNKIHQVGKKKKNQPNQIQIKKTRKTNN